MSIRQPNRLKRASRSPNLPEPLLSRNVTPGLNRNPGSRPQANSAFRATNSTTQPVTANAASQIFFPNEQFDLANEYNPANSTFTPQTTGVYSLQASYAFQPAVIGNFSLEIVFLINGVTFSLNNESFVGSLTGIISTSDILQLNAEDEVTVAMRSTAAGTILASSGTHFAAARLSSSGI